METMRLMRTTVMLLALAAGLTTGGSQAVRGQGIEPPVAMAGFDRPVRVIHGRFTSDVRLTGEVVWVLRGEVAIAAPARIVIEPGTRVVADSETKGSLLIERGAQIQAEGTVDAPIVFVSDAPLVTTSAGVETAPAAAGPDVPAADGPAPTEVAPEDTRVLQGRITEDVTLTNDVNWEIRGLVFVAPSASVVVEPGAQVTADAATQGTLIVEGNARLVADGATLGAPVLFTKDEPLGAQGWSGLVINAASPVSVRALRDSSRALSTSAELGENGGSEKGGDTRQVIGPANTVAGLDKPVRVMHGRFTGDVHLTADTYWVLRGAVFIGAPGRIIIDPGTRVVGELATAGTLVIERGAQIIADGTAAAPIVFTSDQPIGQRGRGDWGGLIINGNAPINLVGGVGIGEGGTGVYGGNDPDDTSGILRYVRVEFAGIEFSPDNELNGIAFQGVGRGTIVDHIQVSFNKDDGIEMFGGTVDIRHAVLTGIGDDTVDWTFGWQGRMQFVIGQQRGDDADRGIEADNQANNNELLPRSKPTIYNMTLVGDPDANEGPESTQGMELREGTAGIIRNFIVIGFKLQSFRVTGASSAAQVTAGELSVRHGIIFGNGTNLHGGINAIVANSGGTIDVVDPVLVRPYDHANPDFKPAAGSPALTLGFETPPGDGFFDTTVTYRGALSDDPAQDWTLGWTDYAQN
jgi:hypothetical protein